ncbi:hypothetical protein M9458_044430, partial [Cirrhinus mrigala]
MSPAVFSRECEKCDSLLVPRKQFIVQYQLSLPLEINCVVAYSFTNRTKHLSITELCLTFSG